MQLKSENWEWSGIRCHSSWADTLYSEAISLICLKVWWEFSLAPILPTIEYTVEYNIWWLCVTTSHTDEVHSVAHTLLVGLQPPTTPSIQP